MSRKTSVRSYERRDGTKVSQHERSLNGDAPKVNADTYKPPKKNGGGYEFEKTGPGQWRLSDDLTIRAQVKPTKMAFKHVAVLYEDDREVHRSSISYQNRTWERFEFEDVLQKLLRTAPQVDNQMKDAFIEWASGKDLEEVNQRFSAVGAMAALGEVMTDSQEEKNQWKKRMLEAGMPGLDVPEDWDELSEDEKEERLNKVIKELRSK